MGQRGKDRQHYPGQEFRISQQPLQAETKRGQRVVQFGKGGYDYAEIIDKPGRSYEMFCFEQLANDVTRDEILIGPNIINDVFSRMTIEGSVPDMLTFSRDKQTLWHLSGIWECRNSRSLEVPTKLENFSVLLSRLRSRHLLLPTALQKLQAAWPLSALFDIPADQHVEVTFVAPDLSQIIHHPRTQFQVSYLRMDRREDRSR